MPEDREDVRIAAAASAEGEGWMHDRQRQRQVRRQAVQSSPSLFSLAQFYVRSFSLRAAQSCFLSFPLCSCLRRF